MSPIKMGNPLDVDVSAAPTCDPTPYSPLNRPIEPDEVLRPRMPSPLCSPRALANGCDPSDSGTSPSTNTTRTPIGHRSGGQGSLDHRVFAHLASLQIQDPIPSAPVALRRLHRPPGPRQHAGSCQ